MDEDANHITISIHSGTDMHDDSSAENKLRAEQAGLALHPAFKKFACDCFPTVDRILLTNGERLLDLPLVYLANALTPATGTSATATMHGSKSWELIHNPDAVLPIRHPVTVGNVMEGFVKACRKEWETYKGWLEGIWKGDTNIEGVKNREDWMKKHGMVRNTYKRFYKLTGDIWVEMTEEGEVGIFINLSR